MSGWRRVTVLVRDQAMVEALEGIERLARRGICRIESDEPAPDVCRVCTLTGEHHKYCPEGENRHGYTR